MKVLGRKTLDVRTSTYRVKRSAPVTVVLFSLSRTQLGERRHVEVLRELHHRLHHAAEVAIAHHAKDEGDDGKDDVQSGHGVVPFRSDQT